MQDLSLHILDVAENALEAGATWLRITIAEDTTRDSLTLEITDNGRGMDAVEAERAVDPFYTTRTTRRVGLGLPLLESAARAADGSLEVRSSPGSGTTVRAEFRHSLVDRKPFGDLPATVVTLLARRPDLDLVFRHERDGRTFTFTSRECREHLGGMPVMSAGVLAWIGNYLRQEESGLSTTA